MCLDRVLVFIGKLSLNISHGFVSQLVAAFIFGVTGMAFHPHPGDFMFFAQAMQFLPKFLVLNRLTGSGHPAFFDPAMNPFCYPFYEVLRVGGQGHLIGLAEFF